ncbi:uncharacterized protein [Nerophis lumbriciformis]|uniref:uncharacterized protein n=1 Tax=Nerophis lumbriciformis TaxID=546530 RepID=UPI002ADF4B8A|nr:gastrula zinc finger protein XlCGF8.2DB-like [Nerophis lumbriciformis]
MLKDFIKERLMAAADEICSLFERTIASYEEELSRTREEKERHQTVRHIEDVQQVIGHQKECPLQTQGDPQSPHIKYEEEAISTTQEVECLLGLEEADITQLPLTGVSVKTEDHKEKPQADNLLAPLTDSEAMSPEDEDRDDTQEPASSDTDCEGDMRIRIDNKHSDCSKKKAVKKCLTCSICAKRFSYESHLNAHMQSHNAKPFSCSVCHERFTQKVNMRSHMRTHTGEKPFICSVCGECFSSKSNMKRHVRTHTGEKPFRCSVCHIRVSRKTSMVLHLRTHTGEKPFSCSVCGESFSTKGNLNTHKRTHTGEKPFCCPVCGKRFSQKVNMGVHMRIHTGEKPFTCSICGIPYSYKRSLHSHMRGHI